MWSKVRKCLTRKNRGGQLDTGDTQDSHATDQIVPYIQSEVIDIEDNPTDQVEPDLPPETVNIPQTTTEDIDRHSEKSAGINSVETQTQTLTASVASQTQTTSTPAASQTEPHFVVLEASRFVTIYVDVENSCKEVWKYLLMWLSYENLWDTCHVILYTGNMNYSHLPSFLKRENNLTFKPNACMIKQLADVMLTIDIFDNSVARKMTGKHVILAGSDGRYIALQYLIKGYGVDCHLIQHADPKYDTTIGRLYQIFQS